MTPSQFMELTASAVDGLAYSAKTTASLRYLKAVARLGGLTLADAARRVVQPRPQGHDDSPGL